MNAKMYSMFGMCGSAFGVALMELAKTNDKIRVLSSDMSTPAGLDKFKTTYPDRFFNVGIAEQNMIGIGAGLTDEGFKVIDVAQACFISMRAFEPVRQYLGYMKSKQILVGIGAGLSLQLMGNTHYAIEDIALMRTIPGMTILCPADAMEAAKALEAAINFDGPIYIRLGIGTTTPIVYADDYDYQIGKATQIKEGTDVQVIATGSLVNEAVKAADELSKDKISVQVTNMHTIKPLDIDAINWNAKLIISLEEHSIVGGLGDSIASEMSKRNTHPKLIKMGLNDCFSQNVGTYQFLLEKNCLTHKYIINQIISNL